MQAITSNDLPTLQKMATTLRFLCADIVQEANSGHPGTPMGLAEFATTLSYHINLNPKNPKWLNRDRLVFSGGHASALLYALLHLWGFELSLEDLRSFRKLHSKTPGHPEFPLTHGVEITTGPLGQGIANAVGFALAAKRAREILGKEVIHHKVYCFCGDGDLQEGISYEASSLAGMHKLSDLIIIYDSNRITIEGETDIAFCENIKLRFESQGFLVLECDGHNFLEIDKALHTAKNQDSKPTIIIAHTTIGKGAIGLEGSEKTHGAPLGEEVLNLSKKQANMPLERFYIPEEVRFWFAATQERGASLEAQWQNTLDDTSKHTLDALINPDFSQIVYPHFEEGASLATRASNGQILNAISEKILGFMGGSADLAPSNNTHLKNSSDFPKGKNFHFGIREHAMGAITNAIANYGLFLPFCATFFVFSDYMAASVRVASIMKTKVFYIWTHDSIGVGEDGATHEPIEQLSHFRAMPNLLVFRPACANENIACWQVALEQNAPCAFVLSRQNLKNFHSGSKADILKGGYIVRDSTKPQITLLASGSEVGLALDSAKELESSGIATRVVSVPCYDLFIAQDKAYRDSVLQGRILAIEAARGLEWFRFADDVVCMESVGHSASGDVLFKHFGFSVENVVKRAKNLLI